jgi:hypothetical protein
MIYIDSFRPNPMVRHYAFPHANRGSWPAPETSETIRLKHFAEDFAVGGIWYLVRSALCLRTWCQERRALFRRHRKPDGTRGCSPGAHPGKPLLQVVAIEAYVNHLADVWAEVTVFVLLAFRIDLLPVERRTSNKLVRRGGSLGRLVGDVSLIRLRGRVLAGERTRPAD